MTKYTKGYTKGKWTVGPASPGFPRCGGGDHAIINDGAVIAEAYHWVKKERFEDAEANARLIAAAPLQHEALKAVEWVKHGTYGVPYCPWCHTTKDNGHDTACLRQAAIRAAEGEE